MASTIKADLLRVVSGAGAIGIGKWAVLLIAPFSLLYAYATHQSSARAKAEQQVIQLTDDVRSLSTMLAQAEIVNQRQQISQEQNNDALRALANDKNEVLDRDFPIDMAKLLRPVQR